MNYATEYSNTAPKTAFTVASMSPPIEKLDQAATYLKNIIVTCDGAITYATGTLTWADDIHIYFNDTDGLAKHNSIAAGSQALTDNQFVYVSLDETDDTVLTVDVDSITTDAASNFIAYHCLVLGYRNAADDLFYPVALTGAIVGKLIPAS